MEKTIYAVSDDDNLESGNVDFHNSQDTAEGAALRQAEYYNQEYFVLEVTYKPIKRTTMTLEDYE